MPRGIFKYLRRSSEFWTACGKPDRARHRLGEAVGFSKSNVWGFGGGEGELVNQEPLQSGVAAPLCRRSPNSESVCPYLGTAWTLESPRYRRRTRVSHETYVLYLVTYATRSFTELQCLGGCSNTYGGRPRFGLRVASPIGRDTAWERPWGFRSRTPGASEGVKGSL